MKNNEDYLDSLLNNVTKKLNEFDEDFEQKKQTADPYMIKKNLPPRTMKALETVRENQFLREFEEELTEEDADAFLREFEAELEEEVNEYERFKGEREVDDDDDDYLEQVDQIVRASEAEPEIDENLFSSLELDDLSTAAREDDSSQFLSEEDLSTLVSGLDALNQTDEIKIPQMEMPELEMPQMEMPEMNMSDLSSETDDFFSMPEQVESIGDIGGSSMDESLPEGMEGLKNLFDDVDEETIIPEDGSMNDDDILSLLNGMSDDETLSDIGKMLEADEQSISLEDGQEMSENSAYISDGADAKSATSGAKGEKKTGFFAKLMDLLFGEDEDDEDESHAKQAVEIEGANDLDHISDENMDILRAMSGDVLTEPAAKGKKKGKKKRKKKGADDEDSKKEKKKKAPKEKKPKEKKPKKEKKKPELGSREKPLPRGPVIMIWILALSVFALVFVGNHLLSKGNAMLSAERKFDQGDYVGSYDAMSGVKIGSSDQELYERARVLAGVQVELNSYYSMMEVRKFDLALDCLVRGLGRVNLHMAEAEEWNVTIQMKALEKELTMHLQDQFNVTPEQAKELYAIDNRDDYSLALDEILRELGLKIE